MIVIDLVIQAESVVFGRIPDRFEIYFSQCFCKITTNIWCPALFVPKYINLFPESGCSLIFQ